jgi:dUTP pyrophosphatase
MKVPVKVWFDFKHNDGQPKYETVGASGMDVRANEALMIRPGETKLIPTGIFMAVPDGYEVQVRPRSGMSYKTKFRIPNSPGTIDSDYRGELCVISENIGNDEIKIPLGERIGQIVIKEVDQIVWDVVISREALPSTERGAGGFGSTGTK